MKVIWDPRAREAKREIASYIGRQFGTKRTKKFKQEVD